MHDTEAQKIAEKVGKDTLDLFETLFPKDQEAIDGKRPSKSNRSAALVLRAEMLIHFMQELKKLPWHE